MISEDLAKDIAVAYRAYCEAVRDDDSLSIRVWARILQDQQKETGIIFRDANDLQRQIERHEDNAQRQIEDNA